MDLSFQGDSDFDVLVDRSKKDKVDFILTKFNGKRFSAVNIGIYPGVEDWYIFDENSGMDFSSTSSLSDNHWKTICERICITLGKTYIRYGH